MKIAVYTICKDEKHNVADWLRSASHADYIVVADTGSTDGTDRLFRMARNEFAGVRAAPRIFVHKIGIEPWRFDTAHNAALSLVPLDADVCIPLHLDERLMPGWRGALEEKWVPGTTKCFYTYVFEHNPDGSPALQFQQNRIHSRKGYVWRYPDHEGVYPFLIDERTVSIPELRIEQWQDKAKDRSMILVRLLAGATEYPNDSRMAHYLGRELMYHGKFKLALHHLLRYTTLPGGFPVEQAANADCIAHCYRKIAEGCE